MPALDIMWESNALKLLEGRDRYTRTAIIEEFCPDPEKAIEFDPEQHGFVTQVSDGRYSVVWRLDKERGQAVVRAVVPLTNLDVKVRDANDLKAYIKRAVEVESNGRVLV